MHLMARRAAVVGVLVAAASLAVAITARKSGNNRRVSATLELSPATGHAESLRNIGDAMQVVDPPKTAPDIRLVAADGSSRTLADFAGKGVVLNLWATWCGPCVAELPSLDALAGTLADDNVVVVALSSDRGGAAEVESYYKAHGIAHLGIWTDPDGAAMHALGARGIPTTLILDRLGQERARLEGGIDWAGKNAVPAIRKLTGQASAQDQK